MHRKVCYLFDQPARSPRDKRYKDHEQSLDGPKHAPRAVPPIRPALRATRCECRHCHAHTFIVLRTIASAKCKVCGCYDLARVED
jgi:hypothetical protein